jgi:hypothetical protein
MRALISSLLCLLSGFIGILLLLHIGVLLLFRWLLFRLRLLMLCFWLVGSSGVHGLHMR